jgi:hypothetical protein
MLYVCTVQQSSSTPVAAAGRDPTYISYGACAVFLIKKKGGGGGSGVNTRPAQYLTGTGTVPHGGTCTDVILPAIQVPLPYQWHRHNGYTVCNGHSPTDKSVRSGVTAM